MVFNSLVIQRFAATFATILDYLRSHCARHCATAGATSSKHVAPVSLTRHANFGFDSSFGFRVSPLFISRHLSLQLSSKIYLRYHTVGVVYILELMSLVHHKLRKIRRGVFQGKFGKIKKFRSPRHFHGRRSEPLRQGPMGTTTPPCIDLVDVVPPAAKELKGSPPLCPTLEEGFCTT